MKDAYTLDVGARLTFDQHGDLLGPRAGVVVRRSLIGAGPHVVLRVEFDDGSPTADLHTDLDGEDIEREAP